jgi:hypothetical protein
MDASSSARIDSKRTDHGHLGQLLVYASGLEAVVVVWVAPAFRDDHRRTLDWLNERTDEGVSFFGVEVGIVKSATGRGRRCSTWSPARMTGRSTSRPSPAADRNR